MGKCVHCSARIERRDWFCPNCKRSVPRRETRRSTWGWVAAGAICLTATLSAGALMALFERAPDRDLFDTAEAPLVSIREVRPAPAASYQPASHRVTGTSSPEPAPEPAESHLEGDRPQPRRGTPAPMSAPAITMGMGAVTVLTQPPVKAFVYLNGGTLLGETPLENASLPAGKHRLTFWAPSIGGRSTRMVDVEAGRSAVVVEEIRERDQFDEAAGS